MKTRPPNQLAAKYRKLAARFPKLEPFFLAYADESFGSGFVMVRREASSLAAQSQLRTLVITNRHVVGLANEATVFIEGQATPFKARVAYVDDFYDLAVLEFDPPGLPIDGGFAIEAQPVKDQDPVVASGYPGIAGQPSYQVTRGYVSNERFSLNDAGNELAYLQHTAPIDPGSSGGPLTTQQGKLLGVNTLKIRNRENVGLAVPAAVVERALAKLSSKPTEQQRAESMALETCEQVVRQLLEQGAGAQSLERAIAARMVAEHGFESLPALPKDGSDWAVRFVEDPNEVLLRAIALRLRNTLTKNVTTPAAGQAICSRVEQAAGASGVTFKVQLGASNRVLDFEFEQGRWKLFTGALAASARRSFLDEIDPAQAPRKPWKPSLR